MLKKTTFFRPIENFIKRNYINVIKLIGHGGGKNMNRQIISIILFGLVVLSSITTFLVTDNGNAENPLQPNTGILPYDFMWFNITERYTYDILL